ncbi:hypothetical protein F383_10813 [Gossypium arboreum]|uniref:Uncharacterized protein n=1 Tax=Gossypium arboreum TaxID=29729 RepID=A0A0B0N415_GOSAR|nr:hypothetical protein F383_26090 [Gossypium arboreum]KHG08332.1 hypothetical protein F383_35833 [Gossypium arboreum]KHG09119.1 hypothetical protein F383_36545 [Gossypium arboreum]KHG09120.1 hypothetical protein F383_36545 [Gossypium arboreum]KHG09172.1 hypothetical protein F383_36323 [Gossypium arboreum]
MESLHISATYVAKLPCNPPISELGLNSTSSDARIHK